MDSIGNILERNTIVIQDEGLKSGFAQIPNFILLDTELSDSAIVVYGLLLKYAWQEGSCFPGQQRLANDRGKSVKTIQRALQELRDHNYIDWKQQGLNKPNVYYILSTQDRFKKHMSKRPKKSK